MAALIVSQRTYEGENYSSVLTTFHADGCAHVYGPIWHLPVGEGEKNSRYPSSRTLGKVQSRRRRSVGEIIVLPLPGIEPRLRPVRSLVTISGSIQIRFSRMILKSRKPKIKVVALYWEWLKLMGVKWWRKEAEDRPIWAIIVKEALVKL